jgi:hypothetical protein
MADISSERLHALRKANAGGIKSGYVGVMESMKRIEGKCAGGSLDTQYVGRSGPGEKRSYKVLPTPIDLVWDICLRQGTYEATCGPISRSEQKAHMSVSLGRLASGITHAHIKTHESRPTYKLSEGAQNAYAGKVEYLHKTTSRLKGAIEALFKCRSQVTRDGEIQHILELCEVEGVRFVPWFLHDPTSLLSKEHAYIFRAFLYSLFPISSRVFKKYYLMPKIKLTGKIWKLDPMREKAESFESIVEKLEKRIYDDMLAEHEKQINLEKLEQRKIAKESKEQASRIKQMFVVRPDSIEYREAWEAKKKQDDWEKENQRLIAQCKQETDV